MILWQDSEKLRQFLGKWKEELRQENYTSPNCLGRLQPACESHDLIIPNQGHLEVVNISPP